MSSSVSSGTPVGKREVLSLKLKRAILDEVRRNIKKSNIVQSSLSMIIKNASKIKAVLDIDVGSSDRK